MHHSGPAASKAYGDMRQRRFSVVNHLCAVLLVAVLSRGLGAQSGAMVDDRIGPPRHALTLRAWQVPDSVRWACGPSRGTSCLLPDLPIVAYADTGSRIRVVMSRDNPCNWTAAAEWALTRDTLIVWLHFPGKRRGVGCPGMQYIQTWEGTTASVPPGSYAVVVIDGDPVAPRESPPRAKPYLVTVP